MILKCFCITVYFEIVFVCSIAGLSKSLVHNCTHESELGACTAANPKHLYVASSMRSTPIVLLIPSTQAPVVTFTI
jgi:hypothetical protein